jgi:ketosteroid isomerase-like protein
MRLRSIIVLLSGLARLAMMAIMNQDEADLKAIQALNQHDIDAVMATDAAAITAQWSDDFVVLPPAGPIIRGRAANAEIVAKGMEQIGAFEPLEYEVTFEEIKILGDYAYEWGTFRGKMRPRAGGDPISYSGKLMRILQRQADGSWRMHRTKATNDPPGPPHMRLDLISSCVSYFFP